MTLYRSTTTYTTEEFTDPMTGPMIRVIETTTNMVAAVFPPDVFATQYEEIPE